MRVERARQLQRTRFESSILSCNTEMRPAEVHQFCPLDETSSKLLKSAITQLQFSARAYHRILKLSRTIADLAEALQYRPRLGFLDA